MRFVGFRYRDCKWCHGRGCLACEGERDKDYKHQFPEGPKPIATFDLTTAEGAERARQAIGFEAVQKAFGPNGGGMQEFLANIAKVKGGDA